MYKQQAIHLLKEKKEKGNRLGTCNVVKANRIILASCN